MKKIMLRTPDAWSMNLLFHQPSDKAFYIEDCRILVETGDASMAYQNRIQPGYIMW